MKKSSVLLLALCSAVVFAGCKDKEEEAAVPAAPAPQIEVVNSTPAISIEQEEVVADDTSHEGMYRSELTNEWISEDIKDQRPIAAMADYVRPSWAWDGVC